MRTALRRARHQLHAFALANHSKFGDADTRPLLSACGLRRAFVYDVVSPEACAHEKTTQCMSSWDRAQQKYWTVPCASDLRVAAKPLRAKPCALTDGSVQNFARTGWGCLAGGEGGGKTPTNHQENATEPEGMSMEKGNEIIHLPTHMHIHIHRHTHAHWGKGGRNRNQSPREGRTTCLWSSRLATSGQLPDRRDAQKRHPQVIL